MKVLLLMLDSLYQNSLALDYLRLYALNDPLVRKQAEIKILVYSPRIDDNTILQTVFSEKPDIVGFSTYLWNIKRSLGIASKIKGILTETKIILGGVEVSYAPQEALANNPFIDAVVTGEGEISFRHLLANYLLNIHFGADIPGVWQKTKNGINSGGPNQYVQVLDEIPSPFLSPEFDSSKLTGDVLYETYRGCSFNCSYCLYHRHAGKPRFYSLERVKMDLEVILKSPCRKIRIVDSTFNLNKKRTKKMLKLLKGTDKNISVEMSAEFFDEEMVELCSQAGIMHIDIGLQSATDRVLKAVNRSWHNKKAFRKNFVLLSKHPKITLNLELICGLPGETYQSFRTSVDKAIGYKPDHISIYKLQVLGGSALRDNTEKYGIKYMLGPPYTVIETASMSKEDLKNLELMMFSNIILYNTGIARFALRLAAKRYKLKFSRFYEMFTNYCLKKDLYSDNEMRSIVNHYAVGNRFDRPLPKVLSINYLKSICSSFFFNLAEGHNDIRFEPVFDEFIDYGYALASLDNTEREKMQTLSEKNSDSNIPSLSRYSSLKSYSSDFFQSLKHVGIKLSESNPFGLAFFIHKRLGPTTLALNKDIYQFLSLCDGMHTITEIIDIIDLKSGLRCDPEDYASIIQTILALQSDLRDIGLLI